MRVLMARWPMGFAGGRRNGASGRAAPVRPARRVRVPPRQEDPHRDETRVPRRRRDARTRACPPRSSRCCSRSAWRRGGRRRRGTRATCWRWCRASSASPCSPRCTGASRCRTWCARAGSSTCSSSCAGASTPTPRRRSATGRATPSTLAQPLRPGRPPRARLLPRGQHPGGSPPPHAARGRRVVRLHAVDRPRDRRLPWLIEWWTTLVVAGDVGVAFLGSQGDPWDAQWDMFLALVGAAISLPLLSRAHDRSMRKAGILRDVG